MLFKKLSFCRQLVIFTTVTREYRAERPDFMPSLLPRNCKPGKGRAIKGKSSYDLRFGVKTICHLFNEMAVSVVMG